MSVMLHSSWLRKYIIGMIGHALHSQECRTGTDISLPARRGGVTQHGIGVKKPLVVEPLRNQSGVQLRETRRRLPSLHCSGEKAYQDGDSSPETWDVRCSIFNSYILHYQFTT